MEIIERASNFGSWSANKLYLKCFYNMKDLPNALMVYFNLLVCGMYLNSEISRDIWRCIVTRLMLILILFFRIKKCNLGTILLY